MGFRLAVCYFLLLRQKKVTKEKATLPRRPLGLPSVAGENGAIRKLALRAQTDGSHDSRFRLQPKLRRRDSGTLAGARPLIPAFSPARGEGEKKTRVARQHVPYVPCLWVPLLRRRAAQPKRG